MNVKPLRYVRVSGNTVGFSEIQTNETIAWTDIDHPAFATVATSGSYNDLLNTPSIPTDLNSLTDVVITNVQSGQGLVWNSTALRWENGTVGGGGGASALDDLTDVTLSTPTNGQVLKYNGTTWVNAAESGGSGGGTVGFEQNFLLMGA
jgi:hypothetical protein